MVPAQTLIQSETPLPMVGRVSSGVMSLISAAQILGLTLSGVSSAAIGLRPLFFSSAALLATLALSSKLFNHPIEQLQRFSFAAPATLREKCLSSKPNQQTQQTRQPEKKACLPLDKT